jgi:hypothetical protein
LQRLIRNLQLFILYTLIHDSPFCLVSVRPSSLQPASATLFFRAFFPSTGNSGAVYCS